MSDGNGNAAKKIKVPTLADAGKTLGAADVVLESLPDAKNASTDSSSSSLSFGSCHLPPRLFSDTFPAAQMPPAAAAQLIRGFRALDARPSLNVASFVTTTIEDECRDLMTEALNVNFIDEEEYESTAQIHAQTVSMLGDLLHAEKTESADGGPARYTGTSTVGSSEAILLAYLAAKRRWQERRKAAGLPVDGVKCSVVVPSSYHVCHEKAANYFELELRVIPLKPHRLYATADDFIPFLDDSVCLCSAVAGTTYTGHFDDVAGISAALEEYNARTGSEIGLHLDSASGGFPTAVLFPELKADFRSKSVVSMNLSGHKTGQVCAGVGWVMFRSRKYLPESLVFHDSYLGADQISFTLNFSKGASQIIAQAYMFLRLGRLGYQQVLGDCWRVSAALADMISATGAFEIVSPRAPTPGIALVAFRLAASHRNRGYDEHDISDGLRERGWVVPAYPLPAGTEDPETGVAPLVLRAVCRADLSFGLAATLAADVARALDRLEQREARDREEAIAARTTQAWKSAKNKAKARKRHEAARAAREAAALRAELEEKQKKAGGGGGGEEKAPSTADLAARAEQKGAEAAAAAAAVGAEGGLRHGGVC